MSPLDTSGGIIYFNVWIIDELGNSVLLVGSQGQLYQDNFFAMVSGSLDLWPSTWCIAWKHFPTRPLILCFETLNPVSRNKYYNCTENGNFRWPGARMESFTLSFDFSRLLFYWELVISWFMYLKRDRLIPGMIQYIRVTSATMLNGILVKTSFLTTFFLYSRVTVSY